MHTLRDVKVLKGVKVLMRVDFNVPVENGVVVDDFRIRKILPTLTYLKEKGARTILISHIENNASVLGAKGDGKKELPSLAPVVEHLKKLGVACTFIKNYKNAVAATAEESFPEGSFILLENLRMNPGEVKNDPVFARELASLGDIYVNEAFAVSHRTHASVVAVTQFLPSYAGFLFESEISHLSEAFHPKRPFLFILCGAKFETKLPLIEKFIQTADTVYVGGALAHNFFKEKGYELGTSLVSADNFDLKRFFTSKRLLLPIDVLATRPGHENVSEAVVKKPNEIKPDEKILDAGPATVAMLKNSIALSHQILWNGPLGAYEQGFKQPTDELAEAIAASSAPQGTSDTSSKSGKETIVGGGDTLASIAELNIESQFSFVSTGGGAMLDFLANETLPALEALEKAAKQGD